METSKLKKFAQDARRQLLEQVAAKLTRVLADGSMARRESAAAVKELEEQIAASSRKQVIERVAYTWFNRFCALRFMDANRYTRIGTVSPTEGFHQPEILMEAKQGHIDDEWKCDKARVLGLLDGTLPSNDAQQEAYRLLLVAVCNAYHALMPFLFEKIADYTELLLPDDLLSESSVLSDARETLTHEACQDVEVIGWLYQFYISEKKDDVFAALKQGKKITPENIPAATQLFTPHWIVRYLVENSLGRLWMLNHPDSKLVEQMDYYIRPVSDKALAVGTSDGDAPDRSACADPRQEDFLRISSPEEIKICDPACGSGHMLTYAFDLLYAIYEEQGYQATDIPRLILKNNLYGIEIDQRAGALAAFALTMKAREKYRRFLQSGKVVQPNICVLENIHIVPEDLSAYMDQVGRDLFSGGLQGVVNRWEEADNFGSLIRPLVTDVSEVLALLRERQMGEDLFLAGVHQKVLKALRQADYLSPKYHVVVMNPPYMGVMSLNRRFMEYGAEHFPTSKSDTFAMFIERATEFVVAHGLCGVLTMQSWMFLASYESMRRKLLKEVAIKSLLHLGPHAFDTIGGEVVQTAAMVVSPCERDRKFGLYFDLSEPKGEEAKRREFLRKLTLGFAAGGVFRVASTSFGKVPDSPIVYDMSEKCRDVFANCRAVGDVAIACAGLTTGDNTIFQREWHEVSYSHIGIGASSPEDTFDGPKWFPCNSGGTARAWYGNNETVVDWQNDGERITNFRDSNGRRKSSPRSRDRYFSEGVTWSKIGSGRFAARFFGSGFIFDDTGQSCFPKNRQHIAQLTAVMCSETTRFFLGYLSNTLSFNKGDIERVPIPDSFEQLPPLGKDLVNVYKADWDEWERSWDFIGSPLIGRKRSAVLKQAFQGLCTQNSEKCSLAIKCQTKLNSALIAFYSLEEEVSATPAIESVTLTSNPVYRYGSDKSESELEALLLADTMREFISYAVGCMLGRYSLDKPGLILANAGETADDYRRQIPHPTFPPDEDNVIPLLDGDWFPDDISERYPLKS